MGAKLCRLETIRMAVAPWQQAEIDRIATRGGLMADNTEDAIHFLNAHQNGLEALQKVRGQPVQSARSL
jgi:hypothetical protein